MRRWLVVALMASLLVPLADIPAGAAGSPTPGFAVSAVGFESFFRFRARPGQRLRAAVRLTSLSTRPLTAIVRTRDVSTAATGGLAYGQHRAQGDGRWLTLGRSRRRLAPGTSITVPFTVNVGPCAVPGDHFAGLVLLNRAQLRAARRHPDRGGFTVRFLPRLAIAVRVSLPGPARRELTVGNASITVSPAETSATLVVRNTGALLVPQTTGELSLLRGARVLATREVMLDAFVPRTGVTLHVPFRDRPEHGSYRVRGVLRPRGAAAVHVDDEVRFGAAQGRELRRETGTSPANDRIPSALAMIAAAGGLLALASILSLARSRGRLQRDLATRRAGDDPGAPPPDDG